MQNPYTRYEKNKVETKSKKTPVRHKPSAKPSQARSHSKTPKKEFRLNAAYILLSAFGVGLSFYIFAYTNDFLDLISRIEIQSTQSQAADEEESTPDSEAKEAKSAPLPVGKVSERKSDGDNLTMKNANVYKALKDKRRELEKKERRLAQLEEDLHHQKIEIEKQLKEMQEMRRNISSKLDKKVIADQESIDKLVGVYSNMKPKNAATIISQIDDDLAVKVLEKMKKQNAAAILNYIEPSKAQSLSEKFTGLKK